MQARSKQSYKLGALALLLLGLALLTACASGGSGGSGGATETPSAGPATRTQVAACARVPMYNDNLFTQGGTGSLPTDFVPPPPGATLCGTVNETRTTFYADAADGNSIIAYYVNALQAQGYALTPVKQGCTPSNLTFDFSKQAVATGQVYTIPEGGYYTIIYTPQKK